MKKALIILIAFLLIAPQAFAAKDKESKIGYVDLLRVFGEYEKTQESEAALEKKAEGKNKERDKLVGEIKKLQDEAELLSESEREKKASELEEKLKDLRDFDRATREELNRERDSMGRDVLIEINKTIVDYGKKNNFDLILDSRTLFYGGEAMDISNDIIKEINKKK